MGDLLLADDADRPSLEEFRYDAYDAAEALEFDALMRARQLRAQAEVEVLMTEVIQVLANAFKAWPQ